LTEIDRACGTAAGPLSSVQTHSQSSLADDEPPLCRHTGEGRCPGYNWFPAFAGKTRTEAELNRLNVSEVFMLTTRICIPLHKHLGPYIVLGAGQVMTAAASNRQTILGLENRDASDQRPVTA
jgi:hypothetical protein